MYSTIHYKTDLGSDKKPNKKWKIVKIILDALFYLIMVIVIATLIYGVVLKKRGDQSFYILGYRAMIVSSESMSKKNIYNREFLEGHDEQMQVGDLVITRKLKDDEELNIYDIVTFKDRYDQTIIHRIVETGKIGSVDVYYTRGDAVTTMDAPRSRTQYEDIYVTNIKSIGNLIRFLQEPIGVFAMIMFTLLVVLMAYLIKTLLKYIKQQRQSPKPLEPPDERKKRRRKKQEQSSITDSEVVELSSSDEDTESQETSNESSTKEKLDEEKSNNEIENNENVSK